MNEQKKDQTTYIWFHIIALPLFASLGGFFVWIFAAYHDAKCDKNLPIFLGVGNVKLGIAKKKKKLNKNINKSKI